MLRLRFSACVVSALALASRRLLRGHFRDIHRGENGIELRLLRGNRETRGAEERLHFARDVKRTRLCLALLILLRNGSRREYRNWRKRRRWWCRRWRRCDRFWRGRFRCHSYRLGNLRSRSFGFRRGFRGLGLRGFWLRGCLRFFCLRRRCGFRFEEIGCFSRSLLFCRGLFRGGFWSRFRFFCLGDLGFRRSCGFWFLGFGDGLLRSGRGFFRGRLFGRRAGFRFVGSLCCFLCHIKFCGACAALIEALQPAGFWF